MVIANGKPSPKEAEAWALQQAIKWTHHLNIHNIIFEMDCETIVDNMVVNFKGSTTFHVLSQNCRANLATMLNSRVSFLKRQVNHVAHKGLQDSMLALIFLIISLHVSFPTL